MLARLAPHNERIAQAKAAHDKEVQVLDRCARTDLLKFLVENGLDSSVFKQFRLCKAFKEHDLERADVSLMGVPFSVFHMACPTKNIPALWDTFGHMLRCAISACEQQGRATHPTAPLSHLLDSMACIDKPVRNVVTSMGDSLFSQPQLLTGVLAKQNINVDKETSQDLVGILATIVDCTAEGKTLAPRVLKTGFAIIEQNKERITYLCLIIKKICHLIDAGIVVGGIYHIIQTIDQATAEASAECGVDYTAKKYISHDDATREFENAMASTQGVFHTADPAKDLGHTVVRGFVYGF